jgi:putative tryptophan/tyrosine transport system substrate-binding protein
MGVGDDAETKGRLVTFNQRLEELGWHVGRNLQIDERWTAGDPERNQRFAGEILVMQPDAIFAFSSVAVAALQHESRSVPVVFTAISDPVGSGFVQSLARPGGNATGFTHFVPTMAANWPLPCHRLWRRIVTSTLFPTLSLAGLGGAFYYWAR